MKRTCPACLIILTTLLFGCTHSFHANAAADAQKAPGTQVTAVDPEESEEPKLKQKSLFRFFDTGARSKLIRIKDQPEDVLAPLGETVSFSVRVKPIPGAALRYQWLHNGMIISGKTSSDLEVLANTPAVGEYTCEISTVYETVLSPAAHLSIFYPADAVKPRPTTVGETYTIESGDYSSAANAIPTCPGTYAAKARFPAGTRALIRTPGMNGTASLPAGSVPQTITWQGNVFTQRGCSNGYSSIIISSNVTSTSCYFMVYYSSAQAPPYKLDVTGFNPPLFAKGRNKHDEKP